jgi:S1-C subfamily serine protease
MMSDAHRVGGRSLATVLWTVDSGTGDRTFRAPSVCVMVDDEGRGILMAYGLDAMVPAEFHRGVEVIVPGHGDQRLAATLLGIDPVTNMGFVRVDSTFEWLAVRFARQAKLSVGDMVVSVGQLPAELSRMPYVGYGRVSTILPTPDGTVSIVGDGLTSPGSIVFDVSGRAVGIVGQQLFTNSQLILGNRVATVPQRGQHWTNTFLPAESFAFVLDKIPATPADVAPLAWIGALRMETVPRNLWEMNRMTSPGVKLYDVVAGQCAAKAGLNEEDIIVAVDGEPFPAYPRAEQISRHFQRLVARAGVGATMRLDVLRGGKAIKAAVKLQGWPKRPEQAKRYASRDLGVLLREKVAIDRYIDKTGTGAIPGVMVLQVAERSPAFLADLKAGDTISAVSGEKVTTVGAFAELVARSFKSGRGIDLAVSREGQDLSIRIEPPAGDPGEGAEGGLGE